MIIPSTPESHFDFEPLSRSIEDLETPVPVIDFGVMVENHQRWQAYCDHIRMANRPHIKTHKLVAVAKLQLAVSAKGICVQNLGEAEVMADAGGCDMLLPFSVVSRHKLDRLAQLMTSINIADVADDADMPEGPSHAAQRAGRKLDALVEFTTGPGRNGAQSPAATHGIVPKPLTRHHACGWARSRSMQEERYNDTRTTS